MRPSHSPPVASTIYQLDWTWTQTEGPWWEVVLSPSGAFPWGTVGPNPINVNRDGIAGVNTLSAVITTDATGGYTSVATFNGTTADPVTGLTADITAVGFVTQAGALGTTMQSMSLTAAAEGTTSSTTALTCSGANPSTYGDSLSFDVTVSGGSGIPTGPVILKDGETTLGTGTLTPSDPDGICTITTSALAAGDHSGIVAVYGGDTTYAGSTSGALDTQTVSPKALTVTATGPTKRYGTALTTGTSTTDFTADPTGVGSEEVTGVTLTPDAAGLSPTTPVGDPYTVTPSLATGTGGFLESNYNITYIPYNGTVAAAPPPPPPGTIYSDTFARSGDLNGSTPDFTSDLDGGTAGATWTATTGDWIMNGAGAVEQKTDTDETSLPFSPLPSTVYQLNWAWSQTSADGWWIVGITAWPGGVLDNVRGSAAGSHVLSVAITTDSANGYSALATLDGIPDSNGTTTGLRSDITHVGLTTMQNGTYTMTAMSLSVVPTATPPTASFTGGPTSGTVPPGLTVNFTNTSTAVDAPITNCFWDFGDIGSLDNTTNTAPDVIVSHAYASTGTYSVILTVSDTNGLSNTHTNDNMISVTARPPVTPPEMLSGKNGFYLDPATGRATVKFTAQDGVQYTLEYKDDLLSTNAWQPVCAPITTNGTPPIILQDTNSTEGVTQRFYRIEAHYP